MSVAFAAVASDSAPTPVSSAIANVLMSILRGCPCGLQDPKPRLVPRQVPGFAAFSPARFRLRIADRMAPSGLGVAVRTVFARTAPLQPAGAWAIERALLGKR